MEQSLPKKVINLTAVNDFGFTLFKNMEIYYFSAFLTDVAGFSLKMLALILTVTEIINVAQVPITGWIIEKANFKWGKYRSWFAICPPIMVVFYGLMLVVQKPCRIYRRTRYIQHIPANIFCDSYGPSCRYRHLLQTQNRYRRQRLHHDDAVRADKNRFAHKRYCTQRRTCGSSICCKQRTYRRNRQRSRQAHEHIPRGIYFVRHRYILILLPLE